ncbi:MAG: heme-binding domain-containing protein, partial [Deltaproteobacteria bacterium]|nr:heme-binding domain-containing protein [Deltaproteobacteria bacterium]
MSKKKILITMVGLGAVGLAFPVINLLVGAPTNTTLSRKAKAHPELAPVVHLLESKCANCHTAEPKLPFYASLPLVKGIVQADITKGRRYFDMVEDLLP